MRIRLLAQAAVSAAVILAGCGSSTVTEQNSRPEPAVDMTYIGERGRIIVGVTEFEPLDHIENGEWTGFDAELAALFAESCGVAAEFAEIDWDRKTELLETGEIDLIWNGMTRTDDLNDTITCSGPYLSNAQGIVMQQPEFGKYTSETECSHLLFACEKGSAGEKLLAEKRYRSVGCDSLKDALFAVAEGRTDAAAVDMIMAAHMTSEGSEFPGLSFAYPMNEEFICVGMRRGSELESRVNSFLGEKAADGTLAAIAEKYGLKEALTI